MDLRQCQFPNGLEKGTNVDAIILIFKRFRNILRLTHQFSNVNCFKVMRLMFESHSCHCD